MVRRCRAPDPSPSKACQPKTIELQKGLSTERLFKYHHPEVMKCPGIYTITFLSHPFAMQPYDVLTKDLKKKIQDT